MFPWELLFILVLILLNGFFAMSELAVISARRARLQSMAEQGSRAARSALRLLESRGRFLSTVQVGITLIGIFAGAYGERSLAAPLSAWLAEIPPLAAYSDVLALLIVVGVITYLSLIFGELVPKQIALANAERVAAFVARPMQLLSAMFTPLVVILDVSSRVVLRLMGRHAEHRQKVTDEEIRMLLAEAAETGVVEYAERDMIGGVMRLADRRIEALMTPRVDMVWLDIDTVETELRERLRDRPHSRFVVSHGELDEVLGLVQGRDLLAQLLDGRPLDVRAALRQPVFVHEGTGALAALEQLRRAPIPVAIVVDEYGGVLGLVTAIDILAAIAGELAETQEAGEPAAMRREDGSWLLDGGLPIDELRELLELRGEAEAPGFHTLAGLVLQELGHVPHSGERFELEDYRFEVMDMDGHRVDKVLVTPKAEPEPPDAPVA